MATDKDPKDAIDLGAAARGHNTATGVEAERRDGTEADRLKNAPKGAEEDLTDGAKADFLKGAKPIGLQKEPAQFVSNGTLVPEMLPSPSGPQPAAAVHFTPEAAANAVEAAQQAHEDDIARRFEQRKEIDDDTISRMSAAEIRAVATDRGYTDVLDIQGRKQARSAFAKAQKEDKSVKRSKK